MFKGSHLPTPVILTCIRWYLRCKLSYQDLEEVMAERGVHVDCATINRWVVEFSTMLAWRARHHRKPVGKSWVVKQKIGAALGLQTFHAAKDTLTGLEIAHMIREGTIRPLANGSNVDQFDALAA